jgi:hypothetical protein
VILLRFNETDDGGTMSHHMNQQGWEQQQARQSDWHRADWGPPSMPAQAPRYSVSYRKMGWLAGTFHGFMMFMTMGLWTPVYLAARRGRKTVTRVG